MSDSHPLQPLLNPKSVALVGVSPRENTVGRWMLDTFLRGGYEGDLFLINPRYDEIDGNRCFPDLTSIPKTPEMAILNVGSTRMEALFDEALSIGIRAFTIFDYCALENDTEPKLIERLREKTRATGAHICGGGGMGYYNLDAGVHATFYPGDHLVPGPISLIAHSGSVFTVLAMADPRLRYNLIASPGNEISTTAGEFLSYAISMPTTRVVALFLETVRDVPKFIQGLKEAAAKDVAVVICKVGKSEKSKAFALTHTGAAVGNQAAYEAVFDRYGVLTADSLDEMMATAALFAAGRHADTGGIGAITDSGGLRQLLADLADEFKVPFAKFSESTICKIEDVLPHTLKAGNPLDAAGVVSNDYEEIFAHCVKAIVEDPDTALSWFEFDATDSYIPFPRYLDIARDAAALTTKPFIVVNSSSSTLNTKVAVELLESGVPLINGVRNAVLATKNLFTHRDFKRRPKSPYPEIVNPQDISKVGDLLRIRRLKETEALQLVRDFGIPTVEAHFCRSYGDVIDSAKAIGFPVALKTATPEITHKSDVSGVHLNISAMEQLDIAYNALSTLGHEMTIAAMAEEGIELAFGMVRDCQFGPLVTVSAGGTLIDYLNDRAVMLAPLNSEEARRQLEKLSIFPILKGVRGRLPINMQSLIGALVNFSILAASVPDNVSEMDLNPIIATDKQVMAVDALIINDVPI